jgi:hypothetical protein
MFFCCNNMYQPVPSFSPLHCKRFTYISILLLSAFPFSYRPSSPGGQHLHIITTNTSLSRPRIIRESQFASPRKPGEKKKSCLTIYGGLLLGRVLLLDSCLLLVYSSSLFGSRKTIPNCKSSWRKGGKYHFVFLFIFSFFLPFSFHTRPIKKA